MAEIEKTEASKSAKSESMELKKPEPKKKPRSRQNTGAAQPWTFPKNTLEEAIDVAKAIEEKNAGNPMPADELVKAVGFKKTTDWRFLDLLRSANQYGLVEGTGTTATVRLEQIGQDIVAPGSPIQRQAALLRSFRNVEDFKKVEGFYKGKKLPEDEFFENTLVREFSISRERVKTFIDVFTRNLDYLRAFRADEPMADTSPLEKPLRIQSVIEQGKVVSSSEYRVRTFLDTCFVMMPFGEWFDTYYKDIYVSAIKEAGFEPLRADELFSAGTVIEQVWDNICKAKILLADLTGKNPNVFYELGLAHAARKAVVFTSANLDDVPFDLRHLRVIIYDIQDPYWGDKLKKNLTAYLKNAKAEPDKSIPQPFRGIGGDAESEG